eukprot:15470385-Alexandrium_andersonii.AAC.1
MAQSPPPLRACASTQSLGMLIASLALGQKGGSVTGVRSLSRAGEGGSPEALKSTRSFLDRWAKGPLMG